MGSQTFQGHLMELRQRLFWVVMSLIAGTITGYLLYDHLQALLVAPLGQQLYFTSPMGGFDFLFRICLFFGGLVAIPVLVYNIIRFIEPTMPTHHTRYALKMVGASLLLMITGVSFAYFVSLSPTVNFLIGFQTDNIQALISTGEYLSFVTLYLTAFGLIFQIPLLLLIINRFTPLSPQRLMKSQKYVIVGSFIAAAIISPTPDALNQTIMAGPIIILYQVSIGIVWLVNRRSARLSTESLDLDIPEYVVNFVPEQIKCVPYRKRPAALPLSTSSNLPKAKPVASPEIPIRTSIKPTRSTSPATPKARPIGDIQRRPTNQIRRPKISTQRRAVDRPVVEKNKNFLDLRNNLNQEPNDSGPVVGPADILVYG